MLIPRLRTRRLLADTASVAALEFAIAAPVMFMLVLATVDLTRALLIWEQMHNAVNAIAQAAEKLSVTTDTTTGAVTSELTPDQMQQAMSVVYAEVPGLNLGNGGGLFPGTFGVGLSAITYSPLCAAPSGCQTQTATVMWSATLASGGSRLISWYRPCSGSQTQVAHLPNSALGLQELPSPVLAGGTSMTLAPQVVADMVYNFTPWFPFMPLSRSLYATATFPAPVGGLDQRIALNTSASTSSAAVSCS